MLWVKTKLFFGECCFKAIVYLFVNLKIMEMKKILLIMIAVLGFGFAGYAQRMQLQIGYGGYTQMDAFDMHDGGEVNSAWGSVTAGVDFYVMPKIRLGATYTYSSSGFKTTNADAYYHVVMFNGKYDYYENNIVRLYAHLGLGMDITHVSWKGDSKNKLYLAIQASPLGAEVDLGRRAALFGELGFGAQGLLQVGFRFNI